VQEDVNSRKGVERIIRHAFEYARQKGPKRVCMSDKSNAMAFAHDLWQRVFKEVRQEYADIESRHQYIDTLAMEIVRDPRQFDVIVTCNLFGDIISDLGAQLAGGLGLAPSGNIHPGRTSLFEPVHGSAPNIAGKGIANPLGSVLTSAMMLEFLGWIPEAEKIASATREALREDFVTPDLGGQRKTVEVGTGWPSGSSNSTTSLSSSKALDCVDRISLCGTIYFFVRMIAVMKSPVKNPPTCAHQATPPVVAAPKELIPAMNCNRNQ